MDAQLPADAQLLADYRFCRSYGATAFCALRDARNGRLLEAARRWSDSHRAKQVRRVKLNARGMDRLEAIADGEGVTVREYLEALMHFAISQAERPGSWEAQGFEFSNYDRRRGDAFADQWF